MRLPKTASVLVSASSARSAEDWLSGRGPTLTVAARGCRLVLFRLAYLSAVNVFAVLRLLPGSDRDKDAEILALRHQLTVVQRQLAGQKIQFQPADRALLAALLQHLPRTRLRRLTLLAAGCRECRPCWSGGIPVFVEESAKSVVSVDV